MADAAISALVKDLVGKLTSAAIQEVGLLWGLENDLLALNNTLKQIQGVLHDAEKKQTTQKDVQEWLKTLKSASLEVENVIDEASTEAMIRSLDSIKHKARTFFSSHHNPLLVKTRIAHKVKNIRKKLEVIDAHRSRFHLTSNTTSEDGAGIAGEISNRETSSLVDLSMIYGRDEDKMMIVDKICKHEDDDVRVYAIWGMGGIGKTTLAQCVYNHETVKKHFELRCWVYVSAVFDVKRIIKEICGPEDVKLDDMSLDGLQKHLQSKLRGKKYFIIMDDIWIENKEMEKWDELCKALSCGAKGSTVMVTTRNKDSAQLMAKIPELQRNVEKLSKQESLSLFKKHAFPGRVEEDNVSSELELVGNEIVKKCDGLPLALKIVGSLMSTKENVNEWRIVNDEFMSEMQSNSIVLPSLRLSYDDLLPHVKRCFAYCCVFSKGEEMSKDLLIELWIANGFIPSQGEGEKIFTCLERRLFFQVVNEKNLCIDTTCKMHDLMHDLAKSEMGNDCAVIGPGKELMTSDEVLHLSLECEDFEFSKHDLKRLRSVRSMLVFNRNYKSNIEQISNHVYLRVLHLNLIESSTLPKSICKLIHLRYLKISSAEIEILPESIINLQNLQVLDLAWCSRLRELPKGLRHMRNLQHLKTGTYFFNNLQHMPVGIKELTSLRRLSQFVVGKDVGAQIGELGNLNLLGWMLELRKLENVGDLRGAKSANLKEKTNLKSLVLGWSLYRSQETRGLATRNKTKKKEETCVSEEEVLEGLEPNSGLLELTINGYMGTVISPSWLVKLINLTSIQLKNLSECEHVPPFGKLPSLKRLVLSRIWRLKCFHDDDTLTSKDEIIFPNLQVLDISYCYSLVSLPSNFPKLRSLEIYCCNQLGSLPDEIQSFKDLNEVNIGLCEIVRKRCEKDVGEDWPKVSHIPHLDMEIHRWF